MLCGLKGGGREGGEKEGRWMDCRVVHSLLGTHLSLPSSSPIFLSTSHRQFSHFHARSFVIPTSVHRLVILPPFFWPSLPLFKAQLQLPICPVSIFHSASLPSTNIHLIRNLQTDTPPQQTTVAAKRAKSPAEKN